LGETVWYLNLLVEALMLLPCYKGEFKKGDEGENLKRENNETALETKK